MKYPDSVEGFSRIYALSLLKFLASPLTQISSKNFDQFYGAPITFSLESTPDENAHVKHPKH